MKRGEWIIDQSLLEEMIKGYFKNIFSRDINNGTLPLIPNRFPSLKEEQLQLLQRPFTKVEIKKSLFDMTHFKSLINDGLHAGFFQKSWDIMGNSLCEYALNFFSFGILPKGSNDTLLALIPKVNNLESPSQI